MCFKGIYMFYAQGSFFAPYGCTLSHFQFGNQTDCLKSRQTGLTAIEFLLVIAAVSVVFVGLVAGASHRNDRLLVDDAARTLQLTLAYARNQAITSGDSVRVCPASQQLECSEQGDWNNGLIVQDYETGEVLRLVEPGHPAIRFLADPGVSQYVQFNIRGDAFGTAGEIQVCHQLQHDYSVGLRISAVGLVEHIDVDSDQCTAQG